MPGLLRPSGGGNAGPRKTCPGAGGGFLVATGGGTSFGLGMAQDTPLEECLPVSMEVEQKEELPGLDMVLVIDKSSSMAGEKAEYGQKRCSAPWMSSRNGIAWA